VVIADRLALFVNYVYGSPFEHKGLPLITGSVFFAFQIFCDFSGYSDIARGSARCMGYDLMQNFDRPYMALSLSEFWRRWHISLSTWFRDYVYIPLGGNKVGRSRWYFNVLVVFILSGIWHGANWTFLVWGSMHGLYLVIESAGFELFPKLRQRPSSVAGLLLKRGYVFILVTVAWVFFRAQNVSQAFYIVRHFFSGLFVQMHQILLNEHFARLKLLYLDQPAGEFFTALIFVGLMTVVHFRQKELDFADWLVRKPAFARWSIYYGLVLSFVCFGIFNRSEFIYFQF
jgi:alginate O-acetyltransferase complex protein AlgI